MTAARWAVYDLLAAHVGDDDTVERLCIGLTWSFCETSRGLGFAQSPGMASRVLAFPGTLAGMRARELAPWLRSWDPFEATVGLAATNAAINTPHNPLLQGARHRSGNAPANLAVFEHFVPRLRNKKVVVIGRYPGLETVLGGLDVTVLERQPGMHDLPDPAAEYVIPDADWVFLSSTTLINKTFTRLATLARNAVTVLMGPSTPWLAELAGFGIDFLAGVVPLDERRAMQIAMEGGGIRLFGDGVVYALADIGSGNLDALKQEIAATSSERLRLLAEMEAWYGAGRRARFPRHAQLDAVSDELAALDTRFKRQWDAR